MLLDDSKGALALIWGGCHINEIIDLCQTTYLQDSNPKASGRLEDHARVCDRPTMREDVERVDTGHSSSTLCPIVLGDMVVLTRNMWVNHVKTQYDR